MVRDLKCDVCAFQSKCVAYKKLKPFTDEARIDLGVDITFNSCVDYSSVEDEED